MEERDKIIPFKFLDVVKLYNGVDIKQTKDYIKILCANYLRQLLKYHGWDTKSLKSLPSKVSSSLEQIVTSNNVDTSREPDTQRVYDFLMLLVKLIKFQLHAQICVILQISIRILSDASESVWKTHTPSFVHTLNECSGDLLFPRFLFDSKSTLTIQQ